jgi:hypothetical protein
MGPSYSFLQFGLLALVAQFEFFVEIPMPAQASPTSWPISAHYSLLPLPARKPCIGPASLPAYAAFQPNSSAQLRGIFHLLMPDPPPPLDSAAAPCAADYHPPLCA